MAKYLAINYNHFTSKYNVNDKGNFESTGPMFDEIEEVIKYLKQNYSDRKSKLLFNEDFLEYKKEEISELEKKLKNTKISL
jgi:hypothetical protein